MPPKKPRKGKKGKGKGKGKKKKEKVIPIGPPLHLLTELYKKLIDTLRTLYEMRTVARRKRIEGWFITKEMTDLKNDNALYNDYLNDNIEDLENEIAKFMKLIQDIKDAIAKAVAERLAKLEKLLADYEARTADLEKELAEIKSQLLEFESLMIELARLLAKIQELLKEIEAAKFDAQLKIRHLTNQFLGERGRLHNHLEEQLFNLIKFCRSYLMPILWNFIQKLLRDNLCLRWKLSRSDERNIMLAEKREEMMKKRKLLALEKPYWDIQWAFFKLGEMDAALKVRKRKPHILEMKTSAFGDIPIGADTGNVDIVSRILPTTQLGKDFNVFLIQRLTAAKEAQERHEREKRREEKRFLKKLLATAQALREGLEGYGEGEDEWEDEEEEEEYVEVEYGEDFVEDYEEEQEEGDENDELNTFENDQINV